MPPSDLMPPRRCGSRTRGENRCTQWAMHGQARCRMHGGKSPQALKKAAERLRDLEHPAISTLAHVIQHGDTDAVKLAAARYLLELLGHKAITQAQVEQQITIQVLREEQPIVLDKAYRALNNGHPHD